MNTEPILSCKYCPEPCERSSTNFQCAQCKTFYYIMNSEGDTAWQFRAQHKGKIYWAFFEKRDGKIITSLIGGGFSYTSNNLLKVDYEMLITPHNFAQKLPTILTFL